MHKTMTRSSGKLIIPVVAILLSVTFVGSAYAFSATYEDNYGNGSVNIEDTGYLILTGNNYNIPTFSIAVGCNTKHVQGCQPEIGELTVATVGCNQKDVQLSKNSDGTYQIVVRVGYVGPDAKSSYTGSSQIALAAYFIMDGSSVTVDEKTGNSIAVDDEGWVRVTYNHVRITNEFDAILDYVILQGYTIQVVASY